MRPLVLIGSALLLHSCSSTVPRTDAELKAQLIALTMDFDGDAGIYVRHLPSGREIAVRADETFPTASLVKVPILVALYERIERGELDVHTTLTYTKDRMYADGDLLGSFVDDKPIALSMLIHLMIAMSDNTASLWCQELAGTGTAINEWLAAHGFEHTRMNSRTPGRQGAWEEWGWGQTSPREMAELLVAIREGRAVSPRADEEMYRVLCRTYWDGEAISALPPRVQAASKQGAVDQSRSEVALVNAPSGDYVFCVITKNQADESWGADNAGFVLIREVSSLLWKHFEGEAWQPAPGVDALR